MTDERPRAVVFDLGVLENGLAHDLQALFHYVDRDGIEIVIRTDLDRRRARAALREKRILRYVDRIMYDVEYAPEDALIIDRPADCRYSHIARECIHEERRPFPLELDAF